MEQQHQNDVTFNIQLMRTFYVPNLLSLYNVTELLITTSDVVKSLF